MTVKEIKEDIINQVKLVNDELILEEVNRILHIPVNNKEIFVLNEDQINTITNRAKNEGKFISDEQSEQDLDKWLK